MQLHLSHRAVALVSCWTRSEYARAYIHAHTVLRSQLLEASQIRSRCGCFIFTSSASFLWLLWLDDYSVGHQL